MSEQIDWSKAPADATHYQAATHGVFECWLKPGHAVRVSRRDQDWREDDHADDLIATSAIKRPWSGEGLPPVGVECEALWTSATGEYVRVVVVGYDHDQSYAVYRILAGVRAGEYESSRHVDVEGHPCFRLTRTPEQSAEDEREAAIDAMLAATPAPGSDISLRVCEKLYDAGYRKP